MLEVSNLSVAYGDKRVLGDVNLRVDAREIIALVGHNGAGKTTLLRAIAALIAPLAGTIRFEASLVRPGTTPALVRAGLSFVPQGRNTFRELSVGENLRVARSSARHDGAPPDEKVFLLFPALRERLGHRAGSLSGGQQQMLALACALLRAPRLIMLDEPSTGLAPVLVESVFDTIATLRRELGTSILVVDQNVTALLEIADRVYVLKEGEVIYGGSPDALRESEGLWQYF
jgi:branched-chain amino acid transport system ATP-binding protein